MTAKKGLPRDNGVQQIGAAKNRNAIMFNEDDVEFRLQIELNMTPIAETSIALLPAKSIRGIIIAGFI